MLICCLRDAGTRQITARSRVAASPAAHVNARSPHSQASSSAALWGVCLLKPDCFAERA